MKRPYTLIITLLLLTACNQPTEKTATPAVTHATQPPVTETPVAGAVAKVGNHIFTEADIDAEFLRMPDQVRALRQQSSMRKNILQNIITRYTLLEQAKQLGVNDDPVVKARIESTVSSMLIQALNEKMRAKLNPKEEDVRQYYAQHQAQFQVPARWHISHILLKDAATANSVLKELHEGKDFATMAKKVSQDPASRQRGGELAPFNHGQMGPEIEQAVQQLSADQPLSGVVKTRLGFHIIRWMGDQPAGVRSFEEMKVQLTTQLQQQYFRDWVAQAKQEAQVEILSPAYRLPDVRSPIYPPIPQQGG
ncbi:MAG: peptidylprolyl isomerase [Mariprofundaceae bacterium]|nr:peptidylprolyl isomerase [Mariprofundaceae bacterium]